MVTKHGVLRFWRWGKREKILVKKEKRHLHMEYKHTMVLNKTKFRCQRMVEREIDDSLTNSSKTQKTRRWWYLHGPCKIFNAMCILVRTVILHGIIIMHSQNWNKSQAKRIKRMPHVE